MAGLGKFCAASWLWIAVLAIPLRALAEPAIPAEWREYVELDQGSNAPVRPEGPMPVADRKVVPLYHFDVPMDHTKRFASTYLTNKTLKHVMVTGEDGKRYVRLFVLDKEGMPFKELSAKYEAKQSYWATKLQSHATYFVWNPGEPQSPFFLKLQLSQRGKTFNDAGNAELAVRSSEAIERLLRESGSPAADFLPERIGIGYSEEGISHAYTIREVEGVHGGKGYVPVHGFMGNKALQESVAKAAGMSVSEWIEREYLPKLAAYAGEMVFKLGLYPASHTQNLTMRINRQNGRIDWFGSRDGNDVLFESFPRLVEGKTPYGENSDSVTVGTSRAYRYFVDTPAAKDPAYHLAIYLGQSVVGFTKDIFLARSHVSIFLRHLQREASTRAGFEIKLPELAQKSFDSLNQPGGVFTLHDEKKWSEPRAVIATVFDGLLFRVRERWIKKLPEGSFDFEQDALRAFFQRKEREGRVILLNVGAEKKMAATPKGDSQVIYGFDGERLVALDKQTKAPIAVAYSISDSERRTLTKSAVSTPAFGICKKSYKKVTS